MRVILKHLAAAMAFAAMVLAGPALAQHEVENAPDPYVHAATGIAFPAKVGDFTRGRLIEYDASGADLSVNYAIRVANTPATFSIYVYPSSGNCAAEFAGTLDAIRSHGGSRQLAEDRTQARPGFDGVEQHFARFLIPAGAYGFDHPQLMSEAWLACPADGRWMVKLRVSYEARHADEADGLADQLLAAFDWQAVLAGR